MVQPEDSSVVSTSAYVPWELLVIHFFFTTVLSELLYDHSRVMEEGFQGTKQEDMQHVL